MWVTPWVAKGLMLRNPSLVCPPATLSSYLRARGMRESPYYILESSQVFALPFVWFHPDLQVLLIQYQHRHAQHSSR